MRGERSIVGEKIRSSIFVVLSRIHSMTDGWLEVIKSQGSGMEYVAPTKNEKENSKQLAGIWAVVVIVVVGLIVVISQFGKYVYSVYNTGEITFGEWNSSSGSFWGAVLGAFVAGIATVATTVLVIRRSYQMDYHRERLEVMPVFDMTVLSRNISNCSNMEELKRILNSNNEPVAIEGSIDADENKLVVCSLKNVGRGIAYKTKIVGVWEDYEGHDYSGLVAIDKEFWMAISEVYFRDGKISFLINYSDMYENEYSQEFELSFTSESGNSIIASPPDLIRKTSRVRYTQ